MTSLQQITMVARRRGGGSGGEDQRQDRMGCNGRAREGLGDTWGGAVAVTSCPSRRRFVFLAPYCHCACLRQKEGPALRSTTRGQRQQWRRWRRPFAKKGMHDCLPGEQRPVMIHGVDGRKYGVTGLGLGRGRRPARETPAPDLRSGGTPRKTAGATGHGAVGGRAIGFEAARRGGGCVGGASRERELGKKARRPPTRRKSGDAGKGKKGKKRNIT